MPANIPKLVSFEVSLKERLVIKECVERACSIISIKRPRDLEMDLAATHANGCPLDFDKLLSADTSDFIHDIVGIRLHLDRCNGELKDHFHPRCALPEATTAKNGA